MAKLTMTNIQYRVGSISEFHAMARDDRQIRISSIASIASARRQGGVKPVTWLLIGYSCNTRDEHANTVIYREGWYVEEGKVWGWNRSFLHQIPEERRNFFDEKTKKTILSIEHSDHRGSIRPRSVVRLAEEIFIRNVDLRSPDPSPPAELAKMALRVAETFDEAIGNVGYLFDVQVYGPKSE